jgi:hypothetical protein
MIVETGEMKNEELKMRNKKGEHTIVNIQC